MNKVLNEYSEKLKNNLETISKESKETIKEIIKNNSKQVELNLDNNKKLINFLKDQMPGKELSPAIINNINKGFVSSMEMSEEVIDKIIDAHTKQIDHTVEFNTALINVLKDQEYTEKEQAELLMKLVEKNFISSVQLSDDNMKNIIDAYNNHINMALSFNKKIVEGINNQVDGLLKLQSKNMDSFYNMISGFVKDRQDTNNV